MSKIEELKNELWRITEIFINAKENFNYCYYLHKPDTDEEQEYVNKSRDIIFIRHSLWRLSTIELAKLFSNRKSTDKFNLTHFISKLKPTGHYADIKINPSKIQEWENIINSEEQLITNVLLLRDKIYAHTDPDKDNYRSVDIYFVQIEKLLELVEAIVKEINLAAFDTQIDLSTPTFERQNFKMIKVLSAEHTKRVDEYKKYFKR